MATDFVFADLSASHAIDHLKAARVAMAEGNAAQAKGYLRLARESLNDCRNLLEA